MTTGFSRSERAMQKAQDHVVNTFALAFAHNPSRETTNTNITCPSCCEGAQVPTTYH